MNNHIQRMSCFSLCLVAASLCAGVTTARMPEKQLSVLKARESQRLALAKASVLGEAQRTRGNARVQNVEPLAFVNQHTDLMGQYHARFQQVHHGVPVVGRQVIAHLNAADQALVPSGGLLENLNVGVKPTLTANEALSFATKMLPKQARFELEPKAELVVFELEGARRSIQASNTVLAFHVHTVIKDNVQGLQHIDFMVDAHTGEVLKRWNSLESNSVVGKGQSRFTGEISLNTTQTATGFELKDQARGVNGAFGANVVTNANFGANPMETGAVFQDEDNVWGDGANYNPTNATDSANGQTGAVDAAYGLQQSWDYYKNIHGRAGIDAKGTATYARVHFGESYSNAFWYPPCYCITFGDGPAGSTGFAALDVVAHEFTHGVNTHSSNLNISGGESGGLNEANSDIHAAMVEFYARNGGDQTKIGDKHESAQGLADGGNWLIGEQLYGDGSAMRYMHKPSLDKRSPDFWYHGIANLDVHYSNGPMIRCFYFMCQGAAATGDASTASNLPMEGITEVNFLPNGMTGVGNDKAAAIWYRAHTLYMTPMTTYHEARKACERAAIDLYGEASLELDAVRNAFAGINVGHIASIPNDETAPVASVITSGGPAGEFTFTASATDNVTVKRVEFYVDKLFAGTGVFQDGVWQFKYDSTLVGNGPHSMIVAAYDGYENQGLSPEIFFTTSNEKLQMVNNFSFEKGDASWTFSSNAYAMKSMPHTGEYCARLGYFGAANSDKMISNLINIPADAAAVNLDYWVLPLSKKDKALGAVDAFYVFVVDADVTKVLKVAGELSNLDASQVYVNKRVNLDEFKGTAVRLYIGYEEDGKLATGFLVDDVKLEVEMPVIVDKEAPKIKGLTFKKMYGQYVFSCTPTDNVGVTRVDFQIDGKTIGTADKAPWAVTVDPSTLPTTCNTRFLTAWAYDKAGNQKGQTIRLKF